MKSLLEIYWEINHQCNEESISLTDKSTMLHHAAEEYVEELLKHDDRWESIVAHDIDYLKSSAIGRSRCGQEGYKEGAELFLSFLSAELKRYGLAAQTEIVSETGNSIKSLPEWKDVKEEIKALFKYPSQYKAFLNGCYLPNGEVKSIKGIVSSYNTYRVQKIETIAKGIPTLLYTFLCENGVIEVPMDNPNQKKRTFQREMKKLVTIGENSQ